ncbi:MAG TPA: hypothetical protein ENK57_02230, partial [Polyangiaceae bacterium]|nr:hypothetical protein [Polyangiaceae bacterium]
MPDRVVIALGDNLLVRGFQTATPGRRARDGTPTHALFVLTRALLAAIAMKEPALAVAVLDAAADPGAQGEGFAPQRALLAELFEAHGLPVLEVAQPEQVVASYTQAALDAGHDVVIVGSDKRLAQLVSDRVWWYDAYKDVRYTP